MNRQGAFTTFRLGKMLDVSPSTIERLDEGRSRPETAARLLSRLSQVFSL